METENPSCPVRNSASAPGLAQPSASEALSSKVDIGRDQLVLAYLRVQENKELSRREFTELIREFGSLTELCSRDGPWQPVLEQVLLAPQTEQEKEILHWSEQPDQHLLCLEHPDYPPALRQTADPPPLLYVRGQKSCLADSAMAVVGSRACTHYGRSHARWLARELAAVGLTVVSGLARGIDAAAHRGALETGATIAVLGSGVDRIYPRGNAQLAGAILDSGNSCLVSEFPLGAIPRREHFPQRNRIISGLSRGVLVVEAAERSGSLITARFALEQDREVFALPGPISSPLSRGCHRLLQQGAKLIQSVADILEELPAAARPLQQKESDLLVEASRAGADADAESDLVWTLLAGQPCALDRLCSLTGWPPQRLSPVLLRLELRGMIKVEAGRCIPLELPATLR